MQTTMSFATLFVLLFGLGGGVPLGLPPAEEDPLMARVAPPKCLFYTTWAATAELNSKSENQTEQLLAEQEVQHLVAELERTVNQALRLAAEKAPPDQAALLRDLSDWWGRILTRPAALFVSEVELKDGKPDVRAGAVFQLGDDAAKFETMLLKHLRRALGGAPEEVEVEGDTAYRVQLGPNMPPITWGVADGYLKIGVGQGALEAIVERTEAESPEWLTRVRERLPVQRRSTLTYIDAQRIRELIFSVTKAPNAREVAQALGLENLAWVGSTTGLDETGFVNKAFLAIDGEPQGLLALLEDPLTQEDLQPIPRDATAAVAARFDPAQVWNTVLSIVEAADPRAHQELLRNVDRLERETGIAVRDGVLDPLGNLWRFYLAPNQGGLMFTGLTAVIDVDNRDRLAETLRQIRDMVVRMGDRRSGPEIEQFKFAGHDVHFFNARQKGFPLAPAWTLTEDRLVVGLFPQSVKAYLSREEGSQSLAAVPEVSRLFESDQAPNKLAYVDTRELFESTYPLLMMGAQLATAELQRQGFDIDVSALPSAGTISEHLIASVTAVERTEGGIEMISRQTIPGGNIGSSGPVALALLLPAVQSAREAARRTQSMNNLKQIGLALHNYHDTYRHFPPQYSTDPEGKPLLSWRVHILPYVEQAPLYEQFRLDEPWDSEHNRKLIPHMPPAYRVPGRETEGKTNYLAVSGKTAIFSGGKPMSFRDITDGTSNTIAVVEANDEAAVIWTRPEDFNPGANDLTGRLVGVRPGGFLALLADGSVRFIAEKIDRDMLKALFTRSGGEVVKQY